MMTTLHLRLALTSNAMFSSVCGVMMLAWPTLVADWLGVHSTWAIPALGAGLLLFAADLLHQASRQRMATWRALISSGGDMVWVLATVILLVLFPNALSPLGIGLTLAVAGVVLTVGLWQLWGVRTIHRVADTGEYRHCLILGTDASADEMWRVVSRLGTIANHASGLDKSYLVDTQTPGVGVVRTCVDRTGKQWSEKCITFEPGRGFELQFLSDAPNFPFPVETMRGGWEIIPKESGCEVMVWWEMVPKPRLLSLVIISVLAFQADRMVPKIVQSMAADATGRTLRGESSSPAQSLARLVPKFC